MSEELPGSVGGIQPVWGERVWTNRIPDPGTRPSGGRQLILYTLRLEAGELNSGSYLGKGLDWRGSGFVSCLSPSGTGPLLVEDWR